MDTLMLDLISSTGSVLFTEPETLGTKLDIPLLQSDSAQWSMLDIAYYLNDAIKFAESELIVEENCAPHYDPGLLSLSVLSTHTGLELYNPLNEQWIPHTGEDKQLAVLWCGKAALEASNGLLRPAVHKVIRQLDKPRMAIWYEICTAQQVPKVSRPLIKKLIQQHSLNNIPKEHSEDIIIKSPKSPKNEKNGKNKEKNEKKDKKENEEPSEDIKIKSPKFPKSPKNEKNSKNEEKNDKNEIEKKDKPTKININKKNNKNSNDKELLRYLEKKKGIPPTKKRK